MGDVRVGRRDGSSAPPRGLSNETGSRPKRARVRPRPLMLGHDPVLERLLDAGGEEEVRVCRRAGLTAGEDGRLR